MGYGGDSDCRTVWPGKSGGDRRNDDAPAMIPALRHRDQFGDAVG